VVEARIRQHSGYNWIEQRPLQGDACHFGVMQVNGRETQLN
jgi:hypothetical protein